MTKRADPLSFWALREMMAHRGISARELAKEAGYSRNYTLRALREGTPKTVDRLEDAITRITDRRGGVPLSCCGLGAYSEMVLMLRHHPATREEFRRV